MQCQVIDLKVNNGSWINHTYVIYSKQTRDAVMVDPAWQPKTFKKLINDESLSPKAILITHCHPDHINLAYDLSDFYNIPVYCNEQEAKFYKFHPKNLIIFNNEDPLTIGALKIYPILTPGHTIGGTCFLIEDNLFSGDTLFIEGCGVCIDPGSSFSKLFHSLQKLKKLDMETKVYPGHQYYYPLGQNMKFIMENNIYMQINDMHQFIDIWSKRIKKINIPQSI